MEHIWSLLAAVWIYWFAAAAICNSIMDETQSHWSESVFSLFHPWTLIYKFFLWDSYRNKYTDRDPDKGRWRVKIWRWWVKVPVQLTDSWHFSKSLMVIFMSVALVNYVVIIPPVYQMKTSLLDIGVCGILWNAPFNLFYNTVLKKKTYIHGL